MDDDASGVRLKEMVRGLMITGFGGAFAASAARRGVLYRSQDLACTPHLKPTSRQIGDH